MKSTARAVVIGGGVVGVSVLYHLAKAGWSDVVLVEKNELTSGSTWHAAGGVTTLNSDANVSRLQKYTLIFIASWRQSLASAAASTTMAASILPPMTGRWIS